MGMYFSQIAMAPGGAASGSAAQNPLDGHDVDKERAQAARQNDINTRPREGERASPKHKERREPYTGVSTLFDAAAGGREGEPGTTQARRRCSSRR